MKVKEEEQGEGEVKGEGEGEVQGEGEEEGEWWEERTKLTRLQNGGLLV